mmetsp:Transcript_9865/g.33461  ORF Transcript_9865/g.33461 Transcript_9865/m.33461 type:complete len:259 (-) Transcript_9865:171-947(-)
MPGEGAGKAAEEGGWDPPRGRARAGGAAAGRGGDGSCGAGANYGALPARGFGHSGMRARPSSSGRRPRSRQHQARLVSLAPPGLLPTPSRARAASFSPFVHVFARRLFIRGGFSVPRPGSRAVCPADSTARGRAAGIPGALFNSRPVAVAALTPLRVRPIDRAELTTGFFRRGEWAGRNSLVGGVCGAPPTNRTPLIRFLWDFRPHAPRVGKPLGSLARGHAGKIGVPPAEQDSGQSGERWMAKGARTLVKTFTRSHV